MLSLKRRRILRERAEAGPARVTAARDFVAAIQNAEAALGALREANNRFYRSDQQAEQASLSSLRSARERTFAFLVSADIIAEAPLIARALNLKIAAGRQMPLVDWIEHTSQLDIAETEAAA